MASPQKERSRRLLQLLWVPQPGDRILLTRNKKFLRGIVEGQHQGLYLTSCFPGEFLRDNQMFFVPRQVDYKTLLWRMHADQQIELSADLYPYPSHARRLTLTRRFHKPGASRASVVHLVGRPVEILSALLELRIQDAAFNDYINGLVMRLAPERGTYSLTI